MYVKVGDELHSGEPSLEKAAGDCKRLAKKAAEA
jgi:hypothetical protein